MADSRYPYPRVVAVPLSSASSKFDQTSLTFFSFLWINFARSSCISVGLFLKVLGKFIIQFIQQMVDLPSVKSFFLFFFFGFFWAMLVRL